jgi:hypothetical protein
MAAKWLVAFIGLAVLSAFQVQADEPTHESGQAATTTAVAAAVTADPSPWIHAQTRPGLRAKIEAAFAVAVARVRDDPECRALFTRLGSDGVEMLQTTLYFEMPNSFDGVAICKRGDAATMVGSASTFVCRGFQRLGNERAVVVLIHEALHHAGLPEYPLDPEAMTSARITWMVEKSCRP